MRVQKEELFVLVWLVFPSSFASHLWNYWNATVPKMICVSATDLLVSLGSD